MQRREGLGGVVARLVRQRRQEQNLHPIAMPAALHGELVDALQDRQRQVRPTLLEQQPHVGQVLDLPLVLGRHVRIEIAAVGPALGEGQPVASSARSGLAGHWRLAPIAACRVGWRSRSPARSRRTLPRAPLAPTPPAPGPARIRDRHVERLRHLGPLIRALERAPGVVQQSPLQVDAAELVQRRLRPDLDGLGRQRTGSPAGTASTLPAASLVASRRPRNTPFRTVGARSDPRYRSTSARRKTRLRPRPARRDGGGRPLASSRRGFVRSVDPLASSRALAAHSSIARRLFEVTERVDRMPEQDQPFTHAIASRRPGLFGDAQRGPALGPATRASLRPGEPEGQERRGRQDVGRDPLQPGAQRRNVIALEELGADLLEQSRWRDPSRDRRSRGEWHPRSSHSPPARPRRAGGDRRSHSSVAVRLRRSRRASAKRW